MARDFTEAALGEVVAIAIGPEKTVFRIHKKILCEESEYFRTAYNGGWKESDEGIALENVDVDVFKVFVHWLYTKNLQEWFTSFQPSVGTPISHEDVYMSLGSIFLKACVSGDRFLMYDFYQAAHNLIVNFSLERPEWPWFSWETINYAFENLAEDTPILSLIVDLQCVHWKRDEELEQELSSNLRKDFLFRVMLRSMHSRDNPLTIGDMEVCTYHVHRNEEDNEGCE